METFLVSFSGVDGAGKTTQIANLRSYLDQRNLENVLLAFWDNVVVLSRYREGFVHKVFKSERGVGAPDKPVNRRDKNVRGWHVNIARHGLYLLDALHLRQVIARARKSGAPVIILDRYIHDELANLPMENPLTRSFVRIVAAIAPKPDLAFLLDANPDAARARKPEYPLDFLIESRQRYYQLAPLVGMTIIPPLPLEQAKSAVTTAFADKWNRKQLQQEHEAVRAA